VNPDVLRFFFASSHYRSPIHYSERSLDEAKAGLSRLYRVKEKAEECASAGHEASAVPEGDDFAPLRDAPARFAEAMDDDFNTAASLGHLFDAVRALNRLAPADIAGETERAGRFLAGYAVLEPLFGVLGLLASSAEEYFRGEVPAYKVEAGANVEFRAERVPPGEIERRIGERNAARARKDFAEADRVRKELGALGIVLEDSKTGTTWKYKT